MPDDDAVRTVTVGDARITLIHAGNLPVPADELFKDVPPALRGGGFPAGDDGQVVVPVHAVLVRVDGEAILIDTGLGAQGADGGGALVPALAELGLAPGDITRVVITHLHGDHIGGVIRGGGDGARPVFPHARHHLPRADREWLDSFPDEVREEFLTLLAALPGLTLDAPDDRLTPSLRSVAAAGHTPGHRCLVVESGGEAFCFLGDLVHLPALHFAEPDRVTAWDTAPALTPPARRRIADQAVVGGWLLAAAHATSPALGRLAADGHDHWAWQPVDHQARVDYGRT